MIVVSWRISWERMGHDPVKNGDLTNNFTGKSWICNEINTTVIFGVIKHGGPLGNRELG